VGVGDQDNLTASLMEVVAEEDMEETVAEDQI